MKHVKEQINLSYGTGNVEGHMARDKLCFSDDQDFCINDVQFLSVHNATNVEADQFSGIIGLAPGYEKSDNGVKLNSFIEQVDSSRDMLGHRRIKPIFSFFLTKKSEISGKVIIGGYDIAKYAK